MPVYNKNGGNLSVIYHKNGNAASVAYEQDGNVVFSASDPSEIKVATYNVGGWYTGSGTNVPTEKKAEYLALQNSILTALDVDFLAIQEYWANFCQDGTLASDVLDTYFNYLETSNNGVFTGHAMASNIQLHDYESFQFEAYVANNPTYEKAYITVGNRNICLLNTHNCTPAYGIATQSAQAQEIFDAVSDEDYFIIFGDFNVTANTYDAIMKRFIDAGYNSAQFGHFGTFDTYYATASETGEKHPTDQIITSPNIVINSVTTNNIKLVDGIDDKIDHIPLVAQLVVY